MSGMEGYVPPLAERREPEILEILGVGVRHSFCGSNFCVSLFFLQVSCRAALACSLAHRHVCMRAQEACHKGVTRTTTLKHPDTVDLYVCYPDTTCRIQHPSGIMHGPPAGVQWQTTSTCWRSAWNVRLSLQGGSMELFDAQELAWVRHGGDYWLCLWTVGSCDANCFAACSLSRLIE